MKTSVKAKLRMQQEQALAFQRQHRALWAESPSGMVSLDDLDVQAELGIEECDPEYMLMVEQEPTLEDWLVGVDYEPIAAGSQSAVSSIRSFFNQTK